MNDAGLFTLDSISAHRYYQVYTLLREWIYDGVYPPGGRLPSEAKLCRTFAVSRITVRRAIDLLVRENLVRTIQGKGTFVVDDLADAYALGDMDQLIRKVERLGRRSKVVEATVEEVTGSDATCADLKIPKGSRVQRASHVRILDGEAVGYIVTFVPSALNIRFSLEELNTNPMLTLLERKGWQISGADELVGATLADARIAAKLNIRIGAPVLRIRLVVFDVSNRPVERMIAYYRADRYHHHTVLGRKISDPKPLRESRHADQ